MNIKHLIKTAVLLLMAFDFSTCHPWQWEDLPMINPECPVVRSLFPPSAPFDSIVTVFGSGFDANNKSQFKLLINGTEVSIQDMQDSTSLRFRVPRGIGSGEVKVLREGNECEAVSPIHFVYEFTGISTTIFTTQLNNPMGLDVDDHGNVFVANRSSNNIIMIPATGGPGSVIAGSPIGNYGAGDHPSGPSATFTFPTDVAIGVSGVIYVADGGNNCIRKIAGEGTARAVSTLVGQPVPYGDNAFGEIPFSQARFTAPQGIATDRAGNVFFTEPTLKNIRVINENSKTVRKIQVSGTTALNFPYGITYSTARESGFPLFVANHDSGLVQSLNATSGIGKVIPAVNIFTLPTDLVVDDEGILYVLDQISLKVNIIYPDNSYSDINLRDHGINPDTPSGIAIDKNNKILYVSDEVLNLIFKIRFE